MRKLKGILITLGVLAVLGVGGFYGWQSLQQGKTEPVKVYSFDFVGMTEFWGDTRESYGPVSSDRIQTIYLTDTQTVSEIAVQDGQTVKAGDLLMQFDTTLSQLELERKDLEIQKLNMELDEALKYQQQLSWMRPMSFPPPEPETEPTEPDLGWALGTKYYPYFGWGHNGSSPSSAFVCWVRSDIVITKALLQKYISGDLKDFLRPPVEPTEEPTEEEPTEEPTEEEDPTEEPTEETTEVIPTDPAENPTEEPSGEATEPTVEEPEVPTEPAETEPEVPEEEPTEPETAPPETEAPPPAEEPELPPVIEEIPAEPEITGDEALIPMSDTEEAIPAPEPEEIPETEPVPDEPEPEEPTAEPEEPGEETEPTTGESEEPTEPSEDEQDEEEEPEEKPDKKAISYYMILKMTEGNMSKAPTILWVGVHVHKDGSFSFFDASGIEDYTLPVEEEPETEPYIDYFGSGYTYSELVKMREEQTRKIQDLELKIRLAEADYKIMERELGDGNIYAEVDGKVISVLTEEEAKLNQQPIIKVSGGGGYYVEGTVSELERDSMTVGQEVTVNDWETGMTYTGVVSTIGEFPAEGGGYNGMDNPNASSYPFTVFVDETADLRAGAYVSVQYAASSNQSGLYLQKPFLRTVQGRSFVYVQGEDGLLEERTVTTGKSIWGSYTEITGGLSVDDLIAFPYGKNVKPGVPTEQGDMSDLYNY